MKTFPSCLPNPNLKEWEASETIGDGKRHNYGAGWNQQASSWSHFSKRGGVAQQAGGDSWGDGFLLGRLAGDVADDGWIVGQAAQEKRNLWDINYFGQPEIRHHQPVARFVAMAFGKYFVFGLPGVKVHMYNFPLI